MKRVVLTLCMVLSAIFIVAGEMFTVGNYSFYPLSPSETAIVRANDSITSANIPSTVTYQDTTYRVTRISSLAFLGCTALKDVIISEGVISIGSLAFKKCSSLTSITIPSTVTSIGDQVFEECKSLISVMMSDGLENIGTNAFLECSSLTDITIPTSVMNIGCDAFKGTGIYNNPSNWQNGALYIDDCLISVNADYVGEFVVVPNTHLIADDAFCRARKVSSVVMPNTVTSIGNRAFWMCELLQSITIPASVKYIGDWAFKGTGIYNNPSNWQNGALYIDDCLIEVDKTLKNYVVQEGTRLIAADAFSFSSTLRSITIPNSVTTIGETAFNGCSSLNSIKYIGTKEQWKQIKIEDWANGSNLQVVRCIDGKIRL